MREGRQILRSTLKNKFDISTFNCEWPDKIRVLYFPLRALYINHHYQGPKSQRLVIIGFILSRLPLHFLAYGIKLHMVST